MTIRVAGEVVQSVPTLSFAVVPVQPERLRGDPCHLRVEVHEQELVPLQPGLEANVLPGRRRPVPAREVTLTARPPKGPHRCHELENGPSRSPAANAVATHVPSPRPTTRRTAPQDPTQPVEPSAPAPRAPSDATREPPARGKPNSPSTRTSKRVGPRLDAHWFPRKRRNPGEVHTGRVGGCRAIADSVSRDPGSREYGLRLLVTRIPSLGLSDGRSLLPPAGPVEDRFDGDDAERVHGLVRAPGAEEAHHIAEEAPAVLMDVGDLLPAVLHVASARRPEPLREGGHHEGDGFLRRLGARDDAAHAREADGATCAEPVHTPGRPRVAPAAGHAGARPDPRDTKPHARAADARTPGPRPPGPTARRSHG
ncbi:hypothetical protein P3T35_006394 [Kitasatospora sp. GP30]|nr:hypothetical protein [Kitasatospora sp. GP30]